MGTQPAEGKKPASTSYNFRRISVETGLSSAQPETHIHLALPDTADNTISLCCLNVRSSQIGPKYCGLPRLFCLFLILFFPPTSPFHLK